MNRATAGLVFAGLAALAGAAGCERNEPTPATPPTRTTPSPSTSPGLTPSTRTGAMKENHEQQISTWRKQLDDTKTRIDALRTQAVNSPDSVRMELTGAVHELDDQADKIQSRIKDCGDTVSASWDSCRADIEAMFTRLNQRIREVTDRFNTPNSGVPNPGAANPTSPGSPNPSTAPATPPETNPGTPPSTPPSTPPTQPGNPGPGPG